MSKRCLVITAVLAGQSESEVARMHGVSQGWISKLMACYRPEGEAAFPALTCSRLQPRGDPTVEMVLRLRKEARRGGAGAGAGADRIGWHLTQHHAMSLCRATINRILVRAPARSPRRPKGPTDDSRNDRHPDLQSQVRVSPMS